jgi:hypothetical protein
MAGCGPLGQECHSNTFELRDRPFIGDISGVQSGFGLDQHDVDFLIGDRAVLNASWHNNKFAFFDDGFAIPEFHSQRAFDH